MDTFVKGLVSVISPCYNVGAVINRFLESILLQTYRRIELILVDDGSTDNTKDVIESYRHRLEDMGVSVNYIFQENQGVGGAVDSGLKYFHGEFLVWPDPDDYLSSNSIERKVQFLQTHPEYDIVRSDAYIVEESDVTKPIHRIYDYTPDKYKEDLYEDYLSNNHVVFCPGCFMFRTSAFLKSNPKRSIYPSRHGQNWQMLLPMVYGRKFPFIDEPLYYYVVYQKSLSRSYKTYEKEVEQIEGFHKLLIHTLAEMDISDEERSHALEVVECQMLHRRCSSAWHHYRREDYIKAYRRLCSVDSTDKSEKIKRYLIYLPKYIARKGFNAICKLFLSK